ncbi:MAG: hypothetical protein WCF67_22230 [Chitinophagaceae bacterium]
MKKLLFLSLVLFSAFLLKGQQPADCIFKPPFIIIDFATGNIRDVNTDYPGDYERRGTSCPTDGYYSYASYTSACFNDDWHTLVEDHTRGDVDGNMLLVNAAPDAGIFLKTTLNGFKPNTVYEFGVALMNLCRPSDKCPYPLLANLTIRLETPDGKRIAQFVTGDLPRVHTPAWANHRAYFTTPAAVGTIIMKMIDNAPGGCGNDFALDDITFRECVKPPPVTVIPTTPPPKKIVAKTPPPSVKPVVKKKVPETPKREAKVSTVAKPTTDSAKKTITVLQHDRPVLLKPPPVLTTRANVLARQIETAAGDIRIDLYDNGEIDNDTVSIYHNNALIVSHARLSDKAITFKIAIDAAQPHHELIMVAENLGSIPPNTSLMIVTAGEVRYEVRISSTEQKNAKVVFDLKK